MKPAAKISETEWDVMRVIWAQHPVTAAEVVARLIAIDPTWHPKTVRTLLSRLVQKHVLGYEPQGRAYVYNPLVSERECAAAASESFLERVFGGALQPMLAHFVEQRRLTKDDLQELHQLLEDRPHTSKPRKKL